MKSLAGNAVAGLILALALVVPLASLRAQPHCADDLSPLRTSLQLRAESADEEQRVGTAVYLRDDADRHFLITAYHNLYAARRVMVSGAVPLLGVPLAMLANRAVLLPASDLVILPCADHCRKRLDGPDFGLRPLMLRSHVRDFPPAGTRVAAVGHPRLWVLGRTLSTGPVSVGATVQRLVPATDLLGDGGSAIGTPLLLISDFAVSPGFSGGPLVWSASNFCDDAELAGLIQGGDPSRPTAPSWAIPHRTLNQAIATPDWTSFPPAHWPDKRFPASAPSFSAAPIALRDWQPRKAGSDAAANDAPPTLRLPTDTPVEIAVILHVPLSGEPLIPMLSNADWLAVETSPEPLAPDRNGLLKLSWRVRVTSAGRARDGIAPELRIRLRSEDGATRFELPFQVVLVDTPRRGDGCSNLSTTGDKAPINCGNSGSVRIEIH